MSRNKFTKPRQFLVLMTQVGEGGVFRSSLDGGAYNVFRVSTLARVELLLLFLLRNRFIN